MGFLKSIFTLGVSDKFEEIQEKYEILYDEYKEKIKIRNKLVSDMEEKIPRISEEYNEIVSDLTNILKIKPNNNINERLDVNFNNFSSFNEELSYAISKFSGL